MAGIDYLVETINQGHAFPNHPEKTSLSHLVDEVQAAGTVDIAFAGGNLYQNGTQVELFSYFICPWAITWKSLGRGTASLVKAIHFFTNFSPRLISFQAFTNTPFLSSI